MLLPPTKSIQKAEYQRGKKKYVLILYRKKVKEVVITMTCFFSRCHLLRISYITDPSATDSIHWRILLPSVV